MPSVQADVLLGLRRQLARRRHHQGASAPAPPHGRHHREPRQDRQDKRRGLPRAGLRNPDQVVASEDRRMLALWMGVGSV